MQSANTDTMRRQFLRIINIDDAGTDPLFATSDKGKRKIDIESDSLRALKHINDDKNYPIIQESLSQEECKPMSSWQTYSYPNCNFMHQLDLYAKARSQGFSYVASGGSNDVFRVHNGHSTTGLNSDLVLKILSPGQKHRAKIPHALKYTHDNYEIVRRDALVHERMTKSSHVLPLYGFCGFATVVPYADGGTLKGALLSKGSRNDRSLKHMSSTERMTCPWRGTWPGGRPWRRSCSWGRPWPRPWPCPWRTPLPWPPSGSP